MSRETACSDRNRTGRNDSRHEFRQARHPGTLTGARGLRLARAPPPLHSTPCHAQPQSVDSTGKSQPSPPKNSRFPPPAFPARRVRAEPHSLRALSRPDSYRPQLPDVPRRIPGSKPNRPVFLSFPSRPRPPAEGLPVASEGDLPASGRCEFYWFMQSPFHQLSTKPKPEAGFAGLPMRLLPTRAQSADRQRPTDGKDSGLRTGRHCREAPGVRPAPLCYRAP
jgi:hypothetical protein